MPPAKRMRPLSIFCLVGIAVGATATVAGLAWSALDVGHTIYTPEQAEEHQQASVAYHAATLGRAPDGSMLPNVESREAREAAVAAARERYDRARADLEAARFAQNELGKWLIGVGLAAMVAFGIGYVASRNDSE